MHPSIQHGPPGLSRFVESRFLKTAKRFLAIGVIALTTGCGGGATTAEFASPRVSTLTAHMSNCAPATVHDTGKLVYAVLAEDCSVDETKTSDVNLRFGSSNAAVLVKLALGQETGAVLIPGLGSRQVGLFKTGQWRKIENRNGWAERDGAGLLLLNGELYMLGGWLNGPVTNEVWKTADLTQWTFLGNAPWPPRHGAAWLVHQDRLWVIGGDLYADVWASADGVQWTKLAEIAPFGERYTPNAAVLGEEIFVYAGQNWRPIPWCNERPDCEAHAERSVWKSKDGKDWTLALQEAPWEGRGLIHGSIVHEGEIFLIGGGLKVAPPNGRYTETVAEFRDIWSTADGVNWKRRIDPFSFAGRTHFSVAKGNGGCFVSDGSVGTQNNLTNDLFFAADCLHFSPVPVPPDLGTRHASSMIFFNGSLVILGGPQYGTAGSTIWQYFP